MLLLAAALLILMSAAFVAHRNAAHPHAIGRPATHAEVNGSVAVAGVSYLR